MNDIDTKQLLALVMENASEFAKLNQNMERVAQVLEKVEKNEIDLIGRNKGLYSQLRDLLDALKASGTKMDATVSDVFRELRGIAEAVGKIKFSGNGISRAAIEDVFRAQVDNRLLKYNKKVVKGLIIAVAVLLAVILVLVGLDLAGVINVIGIGKAVV